MQEDQSTPAFFVGMLLGLFLSFIIYCAVIDSSWKQAAVNHNAARWVMNPSNGEVKWQWNDENSAEKKP